MAKISTYPIDATPTLGDKVIGTDVNDSNITKNYTIESILSLQSLTPTTLWYGSSPLGVAAETSELLYVAGGGGSVTEDTVYMTGTAVMDVCDIDDITTVAVGKGALQQPALSTNSSTAFGCQAGAAAASVLGSDFIGYTSGGDGDISNSVFINEAGNAAQNVSESVFIGHAVLKNPVGAFVDVAGSVMIGSSLYQNTNGFAVDREIVIGNDSANGLDVGSRYNVVIGAEALRVTDTQVCETSIFIGKEAGDNADGTVRKVIAIGYGAGNQIATNAVTQEANECILIGSGAGAEMSGDYNVAVGYESMSSQATGEGNTGIGRQALEELQSGISNTGCGYGAGSTVQTLNNTTSLGYNSQPVGDNEVILGDGNVVTLRCNTAVISAISDARDKAEIKSLSSELGLELVNKLTPRSWDWDRRDKTMSGKKDTGFVAQEIKEVLDSIEGAKESIPSLLDETNPEQMSVGSAALIPVLVKAIQELSEEIQALKGE